jgi:hypothetical protein
VVIYTVKFQTTKEGKPAQAAIAVATAGLNSISLMRA